MHKIEVAVALRLGEIRHVALVDPMRAGDDTALGRLPEHLGQPHDRYRPRGDNIGQDLARSDGRQLVDIANDQQRGSVGTAFISACISMTSTIEVSSTTSRSSRADCRRCA